MAIIAAVAGHRPAEAEAAIRRHLRSVISALADQDTPTAQEGAR
jgi:DNA-binding GntR family transcriptional regulator